MDVHHHSSTPRKKWTHYIWEFAMLFLTVTAGFVVENWREHLVENKRARGLAKSLYYKLATDPAKIAKIIASREKRYASLTYLRKYFERAKDSSLNPTTTQFYPEFIKGVYGF